MTTQIYSRIFESNESDQSDQSDADCVDGVCYDFYSDEWDALKFNEKAMTAFEIWYNVQTERSYKDIDAFLWRHSDSFMLKQAFDFLCNYEKFVKIIILPNQMLLKTAVRLDVC